MCDTLDFELWHDELMLVASAHPRPAPSGYDFRAAYAAGLTPFDAFQQSVRVTAHPDQEPCHG